jgi:hypothetical protein
MSKEAKVPQEEDEDEEEDDYESSREGHTPELNFKALSKDASIFFINYKSIVF